MNKNTFTLLTQQEIDTLVEFLVDKKDIFSNEVLNQDSIDKLISLIRGTSENKLRLDHSKLDARSAEALLVSTGFCTSGQLCELKAEINPNTNFVELIALNRENGKTVFITPEHFLMRDLESSTASWGLCIAPIFFDEVATVFGLKYTKETYDFVCDLYSERNFGKKGLEISKLFLPDAYQMVNNIIV